MQSPTVKVLSVHILQLSGFLRLLSSSPENIYSLLWVKIDARSIFSFPGYHHRLRHSRFVAQQHNPGGRAILKYSTFFPRIISNLQEELTPCFGFCFFGKYSSSKASSGVRPVLLCFFFLGCVGRPFPATDFVFTIWVLFSESLRNEVKQWLYS